MYILHNCTRTLLYRAIHIALFILAIEMFKDNFHLTNFGHINGLGNLIHHKM